MITALATAKLNTRYGQFTETLFYDGQAEIVALHMGELSTAENLICRLHSSCIYGHYFNSVECDCQQQLNEAQERIQKAKRGIIILLDQEGKGNGHLALMKSKSYKARGMAQAEAYQAAGYVKDARSFAAAAKILNHFKVNSVALISSNKKKIKALQDGGIAVKSIVAD